MHRKWMEFDAFAFLPAFPMRSATHHRSNRARSFGFFCCFFIFIFFRLNWIKIGGTHGLLPEMKQDPKNQLTQHLDIIAFIYVYIYIHLAIGWPLYAHNRQVKKESAHRYTCAGARTWKARRDIDVDEGTRKIKNKVLERQPRTENQMRILSF